MADSNNPGIEVYLLKSYNPRVKFLRRMSKKRFQANASTLALTEPKAWFSQRMMQFGRNCTGTLKNPHTVCFSDPGFKVHSYDYKNDKSKVEANLNYEPCVMKYWGKHLVVMSELRGFKVFSDGYEVYDSYTHRKSFHFEVLIKNVYLEGKYATYGRSMKACRGMLLFLNHEGSLSVLYRKNLLRVLGTEEEVSMAIVKLKYEKIEHFATTRQSVFFLTISGEVEKRKLVRRDSHWAVDLKEESSVCVRYTEMDEKFHTIAVARRTGIVASCLEKQKKKCHNRLTLFTIKQPKLLSRLTLPVESSPVHQIKPFIRRRIEYFIVANVFVTVRLVCVFKQDMILLHSVSLKEKDRHINSILISSDDSYWIAMSQGVKRGRIKYF